MMRKTGSGDPCELANYHRRYVEVKQEAVVIFVFVFLPSMDRDILYFSCMDEGHIMYIRTVARASRSYQEVLATFFVEKDGRLHINKVHTQGQQG